MSKEAAWQMLVAVSSVRARIADRLGIQYGGDRDLYAALGYKAEPDYKDFRAKYRRNSIARAVIERQVNGVWRMLPTIEESDEEDTAFEDAVENLADELRLWYYCERVDRLACIGEFAILFLGFDGTEGFTEQVSGSRKLLYVMPYGQSSVTIKTSVTNKRDPRFGQPLIYSITMGSDASSAPVDVHWSRVVHVSYGNLESDTLGTPELEVVFDDLMGLEKVGGGAAEMFWRGAFPGLGISAQQDAEFGEQDFDDLTEELQKYEHQLQRYLRLQGVDITQLAVQVADPSNHIDAIIAMICAAKNIPKRILMGQELGQLAGTQDERAWLDFCDWRRQKLVTPTLIYPLIDRLVEYKVVPAPKARYKASWPDLSKRTDKEIAEAGELRAKTLRQYVDAIGADTMIPPKRFLVDFLGYDDAEADKVLQAAKDELLLANGEETNRRSNDGGADGTDNPEEQI